MIVFKNTRNDNGCEEDGSRICPGRESGHRLKAALGVPDVPTASELMRRTCSKRIRTGARYSAVE